MNLSISPIGFKADPKILKKAAVLKNGANFELTVSSKAPKNCHIFYTVTKNDIMVDTFSKGILTSETYDTFVPKFMKKLANTCKDSKVVEEIGEFFASISK